ncbi:MAG: hypothetical protein IKS90_05840 [Clostridia bacterium]|nr:hypothetical protein [Clostridia bacterium]
MLLAFYLLKSVLVSIVPTAAVACLTAAFVLSLKWAVNAYLFLRHLDKLRYRIKESVLKRKLLLAPKAELGSIVAAEYPNKKVVIIQTAKKVDADTIYRLLRDNGSSDLVIASVSPLYDATDEAHTAIESANAELILLENMPAIMQAYAISDHEIDTEIIGRYTFKKDKNKLTGVVLSLKRALTLALLLIVFCTIAPYLRYGGYLRTLSVFVLSALIYRGILNGSKEVKTRFHKNETS